MLGTQNSTFLPGGQYIVKIFPCQPFVKNFAKKETGPLRGARQWSVAEERTAPSAARRDVERDVRSGIFNKPCLARLADNRV